MSAEDSTDFRDYLRAFESLPTLRQRVEQVLHSLPQDVQQDFIQDSTFRVSLEDYEPGRGWTMFIDLPTAGNAVSRCVVLRGKLNRAPETFALYVIAHEFAHAFLRNGGWGEITDKEEAADALAESWGYPKPKFRWF